MNSDPQIFDFAGGEEIELDDIVQKTFSHNYYLRYTTPDGISGKLGFTIEIEENYDNGCCDWDDDEYDQGTDTGHYSDEDSTSDTDSADSGSDSEEESGSSHKKSGSGCLMLVL